MKNIKFKNTNLFNKYKLLFSIFLTIMLVLFFSHKINMMISTNVQDYLVAKVKKENLLLLKDAFSYLIKDEVNLDNLMTVIKNSKEEIIQIDFNVKECTVILSNITSYINSNLEDYNHIGYRLDVPITLINNTPLFRNIGPKIPIKIELGDIALGNVKTVVRQFGINNALLEVYLEVTINTQTLFPLEITENSTTYESLISSKMIAGVVPNFYNGQINSKSDIISLPLN